MGLRQRSLSSIPKLLNSTAVSHKPLQSTRSISSSSSSSAAQPAPAAASDKQPRPHSNGKAEEKTATRDLFLSVLGATTTKRDAKSYLSQFTPEKPQKPQESAGNDHVALLKIRSLQSQDDETVDGLARTLSQLNRLGLRCVVVVDCQPDPDAGPFITAAITRRTVLEQSDRLVEALEKISATKACRLDDVFAYEAVGESACESSVKVRGPVEVQHAALLTRPLKRGVIPVIPSIAFSTDTQRATDVEPDDVVLALTREFAGLRAPNDGTGTGDDKHRRGPNLTLDRIILLDPAGAIPSVKRGDGAHVFVNMEQEYDDIRAELAHSFPATSRAATTQHLRNLSLLKETLALLPPSSSALLTRPAEVATRARDADRSPQRIGVATRRPRNPLIFSLLTDKPLVSSSLPTARMPPPPPPPPGPGAAPGPRPPPRNIVTSAKRGMPLTMIPDPRDQAWSPPAGRSPLALDAHPDVDVPRLVALIDDSFARPLDVRDYLARIAGRTAGVIVAGAYEGGAIMTWETPPGSSRPPIPYLDKFAVRRRSQGAGGVADVVFGALVRSCFPHGVVWRSRSNNPVNKWYFERAVGSWRVPGSNWTMFWTEPGLERDAQRFADAVAVCRSVKPSWADRRDVVD